MYRSGHGHYLPVSDGCLRRVSTASSTAGDHTDFPCSQQQHRSSTHSLGSLGLCTGSLAAAVVSCCRTTLDIVPLAAHAVRVAFRIGICVAETAARIENPATIDQSWLLLVSGPQSAESALQEYCEGSVRRPCGFESVRVVLICRRSNCQTCDYPSSALGLPTVS